MLRVFLLFLVAVGCSLVAMLLARSASIPVAADASSPPRKSVRDFGAVGDGTADDTAAIQKAVAAATGDVDFPRGVYRITAPIVVDLDKVGTVAISGTGGATLKMAGAGPAIRFVGTHDGTAAPSTVKPPVWDRQFSPRIEGLDILGDHAEADGIEADGTFQLTASLVTIRKCRHGIHLVKRNRNVLISACHIYNGTGCGVFLDDVNLHQINIVGSHISYCGGGGVVCKAGQVRNLQIGTCDIEGNMAKNGPPAANILLDSTGGTTAEVAITGCTIQHANVPGAANIRILGEGVGPKKDTTAKWGHITIGDNIFSDVAINLDMHNARGVTVTGNTFWMGYEANIRAENCEQIVVGPNAFERNPGYDYGTSKTTNNAIFFTKCRDCTLTGLHIQGVHGSAAAVTLDRCDRFHVTGCTILDCDGVALSLVEPRNCRVSNCAIRHDGEKRADATSIRVVGGTGTTLFGNAFANKTDVPEGTLK